MIRTAIIDGDIVAYSAAAAAQDTIEWEFDVVTVECNLAKAKDAATAQIEKIANAIEASHLVLAFTDQHNFRKDVMPSYKSNRKAAKPVGLKPLKEWLSEQHTTYTKPGLEGDDVMGILATHPRLLKGERVCVSIDKDLKSVPGKHYNPDKEEWLTVTEAEADYWHLFQTLTGDTTDGYPGCPGIGPKRASDLLDKLWGGSDTGKFFPVPLVWPHVVAEYAKKGLSEEAALQNARVARICRHTDFDFKTNTVRLWTP